MKKIDLHLHTVPTFSDSKFEFSIETFRRYVIERNLDAVAVTNHDIFDGNQFREILHSFRDLDVLALPGIEINVEKGHLLVISSPEKLDDFEARCKAVSARISKVGDYLSVADVKSIYGNLDNYLVIPHFEKDPPITGSTLEELRPFICAGEVDSAKKFLRVAKDYDKPTPVLFSDARMRTGLINLPTRQTYVDCGTLTLKALQTCLRDRDKVALTESDGNRLWTAFEDGQMLSTGLNVIFGFRSSGKTHTLKELKRCVANAKYIEQFQLVQESEAACERDFNNNVAKRRSAFIDEYLLPFKRVVEDASGVDRTSNGKAVERYIESLLRSAEDADRNDAFSKSYLFNETDFPVGSTKTLYDLIGSVRQVIENIEFRPVIEKHVEQSKLRELARELIELLWSRVLDQRKKELINSLVRDIKQKLKLRTSATQVEDVDLYRVAMDEVKIRRFSEISLCLRTEEVIADDPVQGFRIEARRGPYKGAMEIKDASGTKTAFKEAFQAYDDPYEYLLELLKKEDIPRGNLYKLFAKITYRILNRRGSEVSGGERSEFRLLQEISDAQNHDLLLIDEPESSFDNLFLRSDVNQLLKDIAKTMPVVVVTHNSTVGASVGADYVLYTRRDVVGSDVSYKIFSGYATDSELKSLEGETVKSHDIWMDALEAGESAYQNRRKMYESLKN